MLQRLISSSTSLAPPVFWVGLMRIYIEQLIMMGGHTHTKLFAWQLSHLCFIFPQLLICLDSLHPLYDSCPSASAVNSHVVYHWTGSPLVYSWILFLFFPCCWENDVAHVVNLLFFFTTWCNLLPDVFLSRCQRLSPIWNWYLTLPHRKRSIHWKVSSSVRKTQVILCVLGICCPTIRLLS